MSSSDQLTALSTEEIDLIARQTLEKENDESFQVPLQYAHELFRHLTTNPKDYHFIISPGEGDGFGILTCLEESCYCDILLTPNPYIPLDGGKSIGLGSLSALQRHVFESSAHRSARDIRCASIQLTSTPDMVPSTSKPAKSKIDLLQTLGIQPSSSKTRPNPIFSLPAEPITISRSTTPASKRSADEDIKDIPLDHTIKKHKKEESDSFDILNTIKKQKKEEPDSDDVLNTFKKHKKEEPDSYDILNASSNSTSSGGYGSTIPRSQSPTLGRHDYAAAAQISQYSATAVVPPSHFSTSAVAVQPSQFSASAAARRSRSPLSVPPSNTDYEWDSHSHQSDEGSDDEEEGYNREWPAAEGTDNVVGRHIDADIASAHIHQALTTSDLFKHNATVGQARESLGLETTDPKELISGMVTFLKPHQHMGVSWALNQERTKHCGGILADDMGLGKTLQAITLMIVNPSETSARKTNLIVAPLALLEQWRREIENHLEEGLLSIHFYHGAKKITQLKKLKTFDVILTTYHTMTNDFPNAKKVAHANWKGGPMKRMKFHRIILDEAQFIRNKGTRASQAAAALSAKYRWSLTGTPITNSLADVYSQLRFLGIGPYNHWQNFREHIVDPSKNNPERASHRLQAILNGCMLRRLKSSTLNGIKLIELDSERSVENVELVFSKDEQEIYDFIFEHSREIVNTFLKRGTVLKNYAHILTQLLRLRQLCCHPSLIIDHINTLVTAQGPLDKNADPAVILAQAEKDLGADTVARIKARLQRVAEETSASGTLGGDETATVDCPICNELLGDDAVVTSCGHDYCQECILDWIQQCESSHDDRREAKCPTCRALVAAQKLYLRSAFLPPPPVTSRRITMAGKSSGKAKRVIDSDDSDDDFPDLSFALKSTPATRSRRKIIELSDDDDDIDDSDTKRDMLAKETQKAKEEVRPESSTSVQQPGQTPDQGPDQRPDMTPEERLNHIAANFPTFGKHVPSTKMKYLLTYLIKLRKESPKEKTLVISSFVSFLDILDDFLTTNRFSIVRYQGNMKPSDRVRAVDAFQQKSNATIMLMSLKCGGVGLNLTRGNHVINMDKAWSPAVENQAFDRCHRLGQTRDVYIKRPAIKDSVEFKIEALQQRKAALSDHSLGEGTGQKLGPMTVAEIASLFNLRA